jgi:purine-nucleoside phosphorylase
VFQGRVHYYETGKIASVLYPIYVAHRLGIRTLIVTNAAGGVNREFKPADLMLMTDQINLTFENPLGDPPLVPRHRKNAPLYDDGLQQIIRKTADKKNIVLRRGVYCGITGPSYETAAEVKMVRLFGGDAVGMSTVNEVTLAQSLGMRVAGISCITNLSTGISDQKLSHAEVTEVADRVKQVFAGLLRGVIEQL